MLLPVKEQFAGRPLVDSFVGVVGARLEKRGGAGAEVQAEAAHSRFAFSEKVVGRILIQGHAADGDVHGLILQS